MSSKEQAQNYAAIRTHGLSILARILAASLEGKDTPHGETSNALDFSASSGETDMSGHELDEGAGDQP